MRLLRLPLCAEALVYYRHVGFRPLTDSPKYPGKREESMTGLSQSWRCSRRRFVALSLAAALAASCRPAAPARRRPAPLDTTLGSLQGEDLGIILPHEHVFVDLRTPDRPGYAQAEASDVVALMGPELRASQGGRHRPDRGVPARSAWGAAPISSRPSRQRPASLCWCPPASTASPGSPIGYAAPRRRGCVTGCWAS